MTEAQFGRQLTPDMGLDGTAVFSSLVSVTPIGVKERGGDLLLGLVGRDDLGAAFLIALVLEMADLAALAFLGGIRVDFN